MKQYLYLAELVRSAIYHKKPAEKPEELTWEEIFSLAYEHMVTSLTFEAVRLLEAKPGKPIYQKWKEYADKALVRELSFDAERGQIFAEFEKSDISYLPLKGIILKKYYDRPGLRQFSDNDILYDKTRQDEVVKIMQTLGYSVKDLETNHDIFYKEPIFNFELHKELLPPKNEYIPYFSDIWSRAEKMPGCACGYQMTDADFYLFHLVHLQKHFGGSGTGLRYFVDQYYLDKKMLNHPDFDRKYCEECLEKMQLLEFEKTIQNLTGHLFGSSDVDWEHVFDDAPDAEKTFLYVISSGAYGTFDNLILHRMEKKKNKAAYFISRLTCEKEYMLHDYPVLKKCIWLYPVFVVWRLVAAPFKKTEKVKAEFRALFGRKK